MTAKSFLLRRCSIRTLLGISVRTEAKEFDVAAGGDAGFAGGDLDLLRGCIYTFEIREQEASMNAVLIFDDHAVNVRVEMFGAAWFRRGKYIDGKFQAGQFVFPDRRETRIARGGVDRVDDYFFCERIFRRLERADATTQIACVSLDANEAARPRGQWVGRLFGRRDGCACPDEGFDG